MEMFEQVYEQLREILKAVETPRLKVQETKGAYSLNGPYSEKWKKELFFGAAQIKKNYVSFYLMPVYMYPDLLDGISPKLKARMQGKSCFNFKKADPAIFAELAELTRRALERVRKDEGLL